MDWQADCVVAQVRIADGVVADVLDRPRCAERTQVPVQASQGFPAREVRVGDRRGTGRVVTGVFLREVASATRSRIVREAVQVRGLEVDREVAERGFRQAIVQLRSPRPWHRGGRGCPSARCTKLIWPCDRPRGDAMDQAAGRTAVVHEAQVQRVLRGDAADLVVQIHAPQVDAQRQARNPVRIVDEAVVERLALLRVRA